MEPPRAKVDKVGWIGIAACLAALFWYFSTQTPPPPSPDKKPDPASADPANPDQPDPADPGAPANPEVDPAAPVPGPEAEAQLATLRSADLELQFSNIGGGIALAHIHGKDGKEEKSAKINEVGKAPIGAISRGSGKVAPMPYAVESQLGNVITYSATTPDGLKVRKTFTVPASGEGDPNVVKLQLVLENPGAAAISAADFYLYTGAAAQLRDTEWIKPSFFWDDDGDENEEDVTQFSSGWFGMKKGRAEISMQAAEMGWAGVKNQFYTTLIWPETPYAAEGWIRRFPQSEKSDPEKGPFAIHGGIGLGQIDLGPGAAKSWTFDIYIGPKEYPRLAELGGNKGRSMFYGMFWFVSQPMSWLLHTLHGWGASWAVAIILMTLIIRLLIWPLHAKSTRTMKRMSLLAPKMTDLKEKYKDNPQKMQQETMKLYRDYGINPLGGCLPLFLQLPIFLGFYRMLQSAVELRGEQFLWVQDLSLPDTVAQFAGFDVNPLPLVMAVTMVVQMLVSPKAADKNQQIIFYAMPVVFLFICYSFASALALYWTVSNCFSIFQTWIMRFQPEVKLEKRQAPARPALGGGGGLGGGGSAPKKPKGPRPPRTGGARRKKKRDE